MTQASWVLRRILHFLGICHWKPIRLDSSDYRTFAVLQCRICGIYRSRRMDKCVCVSGRYYSHMPEGAWFERKRDAMRFLSLGFVGKQEVDEIVNER